MPCPKIAASSSTSKGAPGRSFAAERADDSSANVFEAAAAHVRTLMDKGRHVILAGWSDGSRERMAGVLADHGLTSTELVSSLSQALHLQAEEGRRSPCSASSRGSRPATSRSSASRTSSATGSCASASTPSAPQNFLTEIGSLTAGDIVVHADHGIGRFTGLIPSRPAASGTIASSCTTPTA